jgi:Uma2 family endonuclease
MPSWREHALAALAGRKPGLAKAFGNAYPPSHTRRETMAIMLKTHRFTVDEYHRMGEAGIFSEDDRVELLAGEIVEMSPIGPLHAGTVDRLNALFSSRLGGEVIVRVQNPLLLRTEDSEPQPDVVLLRPRPDFYARSHPEALDVYLVIEVADTSVVADREVKFPIYARAGVPEAWLLDMVMQRLEVHRQPTPDGYQDVRSLQRGESVAPQAFPQLVLTVDVLLG